MQQRRAVQAKYRIGFQGASLLALAIATPAFAQQASPVVDSAAPAAQDPAVAEPEAAEITVTGSRIRRKDADAVGPLLTITSDDIAKSGATSVGDVLQKLPVAGVSLNSNGTQGTSYGASSINLRYLGGAEGSGNRVLVLVDGHRWVDAVGQRGFRDFVDLNTIPAGMIDGIEILKDGASAIYGADAIAGVVNIKTVQAFDGFRASAKIGTTDKGDGAEYSAIATVGKHFGRASIVLSGSYYKSEPILTSDRALTAVTLVPVTAPGTSPAGLFILPGLSNNAYFGTATGFASTASPVAFNGGTLGAGSLADNSFHTAALPGDAYNTQAQGIYSAGPSERYGVYGRFGYELTDSINLHIEGTYNRRKSDQLFSPVLLDIGGTAGTVRGFAIPNNQAFNPFGTANGVPAANAVAFSATSAWRIRKALTDLGNRDNIQDVQTWRIAGGLDGKFQLFGNDWSWDVYGAYSKNRIDTVALNGVNYDNLFLGLGSPATCAATTGCVPINLFGPMTAQQADYIRFTARESNYTELYNATANATGTLFQLPAGSVDLAVGYEYRRNKGVDNPDPIANAASTYLSSAYTKTTVQTRTPTSGSYDLHEVYGELSVPIFKDQSFAKSLDVDLAARYSRYSTVGGKLTFKAGAGYRPFEGLLFRGTWAQGFRAPSILELYQGARQTSFQGTDPCNGGAAANASLPGCAGVPAGYNQANYNLNGLIPGVISGNRDLKPETSDSISAGIAISPVQVPGLTLTVDYFKIVVHDAIASQSATQILQLCAARGGVFCDLVTRDSGTGAITQLLQGAQNLASISTDGIDATLRYDFRTGIGRFGAVVDASYLGSFRTVSPNPAGGAPIVDDRAGKGDQPRATYPRWKGQASLDWRLDPVDAVVRARYIGPSTDIANPVKDSRTASIIYTDAEIGVAVNHDQARLTLGMNNVFDVMPPLSYANAPINYDIYTYDARGRYLYVRFSVKM
ncbi:MAG: TonB-dependent receptor [Sphingomonas bacterium]|uniref:TonB-dependent receptor n=1 Tax=Sphingomonas bacterium TaxID=1895847 RepID=UPI0026092D33|nr:TonB-dependent receptor [Sphingomonas bacterium]MDB5705993.1 TonB-dependent receptor [Sphingomonas bacterium]